MPIRPVHAVIFASMIFTAAAAAPGQNSPQPGSYSVQTDAELLYMPSGKFSDEIARLRPVDFKCPPVPDQARDANGRALSPFEASTKIDLLELGMALDDLKIGQERKADLLTQYQAVRKEIGRRMSQQNRRPEFDIPYPIPEGIPEEFSDYLQALLWSHDGKVDDARILWEKIVALPADSRRYRGPWALFMLGRSYVESEPAKAVEYLQKARKALGEGTDRLGLAASSLGWEGRALLNQGLDCQATDLYLQQAWAGDTTAMPSLQTAIKKLLHDPPVDRRAALSDAPLRQAIEAFIFCDGGIQSNLGVEDRKLFPGWLAELANQPVKDADENDRSAWAAYMVGDHVAARVWMDRGNAASVLHKLLVAKLLLCGEKPDQAIPVLEAVFGAAPRPSNGSKDQAELADRMAPFTLTAAADLEALYLTAGRYNDALSICCGIDSDIEEVDAEYVGQWVMTTDELRDFVDGLAMKNAAPKNAGRTKSIRALLARRLCRDGKFDIAKNYFEGDLSNAVVRYQSLLLEGRDKDLPAAKRAASLWEAAKLCNEHGETMFGLSGPGVPRYVADNVAEIAEDRIKSKGSGGTKLTDPSDDEIARQARNKPADLRSTAYRYRAADLAWESAGLSPDNSQEKLDALYGGGTWLKYIDPKAADRFYKDICRHCGNTELGKECIKVHWFAVR